MVTIHALRVLLTGRLLPWGIIVFMAVGAAHAGTPAHQARGTSSLRALTHRVQRLERACVPAYTGGGVTQCAQPGVYEQKYARMIHACLGNDAYIGVTQEDTRHLFIQCMDDWWSSH